jgi:hypothetical protein
MRVNGRLWPQYPIRFVSVRGAKVKIGSRRIFVDVPHELYLFINEVYGKYSKGGAHDREIKREFEDYKNKNRNLVFRGKDLASVSIVVETFAPSKSTLRVKVNWDLLLDYLENKSVETFDKSPSLKEAMICIYAEIYGNYISIKGVDWGPSQISARIRENFRRFLRRTGDSGHILTSLDSLQSLFRATPDRGLPEFKFYLANIENIVQNMKDSFDELLMPSIYYSIRSLIEELTRFIVYARAYDNNDLTSIIGNRGAPFLPEYPFTDLNSEYKGYRDVDALMRNYRTFLAKLESEFKTDSLSNTSKLRIPCLTVCKDSIRSCKQKYGFDSSKLDEFYEASSYMLHNVRPLPFCSPLEIKFLKHFIKEFETDVSAVFHLLFGTHYVAQEKMEQEKVSHSKISQIMRSLDSNYREDIKKIIKQATVKKESDDIFFKPPILASIFTILSPSWKVLKESMLAKKDVDIFVERMSAFTFRVGLDFEYDRTLKTMEDRIMSQLEFMDQRVESLSKGEKELLLLCLMLVYLPEFIENARF